MTAQTPKNQTHEFKLVFSMKTTYNGLDLGEIMEKLYEIFPEKEDILENNDFCLGAFDRVSNDTLVYYFADDNGVFAKVVIHELQEVFGEEGPEDKEIIVEIYVRKQSNNTPRLVKIKTQYGSYVVKVIYFNEYGPRGLNGNPNLYYYVYGEVVESNHPSIHVGDTYDGYCPKHALEIIK